jgi:wyosine [tRNA(Phe)-imidazoG37] synthetase (radical SAM superfamily)
MTGNGFRPAGNGSGNALPSSAHSASSAPNGLKEPLTAFGQPRNSLGNRFVYAVISQRARGLSVGINLTPDKKCNFDCIYCEVNRDTPGRERRIDLKAMAAELEQVLIQIHTGHFREFPGFTHLPPELLQLKEVALSGDGEPTLCPNFDEIVREIFYLRSTGRFPFFKIVLITNGTGLDLPEVGRGLKLLSRDDEIWVKLDAGTQEYMSAINQSEIPLWRILDNILGLAKQRPVIIQSLFPLVDGKEPPAAEIEEYAKRLKELKSSGAQISMVQVYSAHRPPHRPNCEHLPLKTLSHIARRVRDIAGLKAEVF